ncbi:cAMP-binding domain of CRP or a regulatory subunit of cAMP-dependent protein kinases [Oryzisolibacter propanilivorax]|uniref:cAMP-binding domain of CRP or a regulatory subunit of cAMP-dependent protein kinases n=1 Tax=Oryzisolibacter propanilivorax TaxID=1527607 RepID=A0A1G9TGR5_9BURK|nr:Crp/Fnr family transcriptional regulator [Oryzisolibacter propanilivorax]SDM46916.1 cAMP-binding domain of CRP or a regulatory subunit of cAMP-dependent protein kinases [Oryzisolibacter propanilivorax]
MFPLPSSDHSTQTEMAAAGEVLRERNQHPISVLYLDSGRVLLGVREEGVMRHQLGVVEGPSWLDAATAVLDQPCTVDMVADTHVQLRRMPLEDFRRSLEQLPQQAQILLRDMATGYCRQTELAVSRLAQDAEARCAQWLLRHAHPTEDGSLRVTLHQRKRLIAAQLGIAPETLSRVLRHLREHGLIAGTGNLLSLPQPHALRAVAGA